jgi:putative nucleotidyltransferase with HDIG domain
MKVNTKGFVSGIVALTLVAISALAFWGPEIRPSDLGAIAFFSVLAVIAETLSFVLARKARGSIAFIPYLAAVLVAPTWVAAAAVVTVKLSIELVSRINPVKAVFNAFTHGLTLSCAIAVYLALGGIGLLQAPSHDFASLTAHFGLPAVGAFGVSFVVNLLAVGGVVSIDTGEPISAFLRSSSLSTIGSDLLTTPIVFVFSWLYTAFGPMAAAAAWVPIVGIRHLNRVQLELEETNQELLQLMVKSIEARDPYTSGHSRRVSKYAASIARALSLSEREIGTIATAALLHDVGKIYEKYAPILRNPGRLTPEEWTTMQEHPVDGANLVSTISRLRSLVPAVRHHHENWDGTGYPDQLAGESIPLASRVIMFADTIDAMTSERPYRGALTESEVRAEILRGRGRQFDPQIADRLLAVGVWRTIFALEKSGGRGLVLIGDRESA